MARDELVSVKAFAEMQGVEQRTVRNWMRYDPPLPYRNSKKGVQIPIKKGIAWRVQFEIRRHADENAPRGDAARKRLEEIRLEREELALRRDKAEVVLAHVHRARVARLSDHFAGVIKGHLRRYANEIQIADSAIAARHLLDKIRDELLDELQRTADAIDDDPDGAEVDDGNPGAAA